MISAFNHNKKAWLIRFGLLVVVLIACVLANVAFDHLERHTNKPVSLTFKLPLPDDVARIANVPANADIESIRVTGFFSDWAEDSPYLLQKIAADTWTTAIHLPPGSNQYKFVIFMRGHTKPVWIHDLTNPEYVVDTWGERNSVIHVPDIPTYRFIANIFFTGLLILLTVNVFIEPVIHRILHWRLRFRTKLMISMIFFVIMSNGVFMLYHLYASRELIKQGVIDNINMVHLVLSSRKINFSSIEEERDNLKKALDDFFWNSKTRVEKSQSSPYQITLSDLAVLDRDYKLILLSHRNQNLVLQNQRALKLGYDNNVDFFMQGILANAITESRKQARITDIVFSQPNKNIVAAEPEDTKRGHFFLGYSTFVKPIFLQGELVGFYAGAIQTKLYGGEIQRIFYINLALIALVSAISLFLLASVGKLITHYLSELALWTQEIIKGNFGARVSIKSGDEIQLLAENLDAMRISLEESFSEIAEKNILLSREAYFDSLTGLPNRKRMMLDVLTQPNQAIILINIDSFRGLNDFFGNDVGDNVLTEVTQRLHSITDIPGHRLYKIGPDEFVVVISDIADQEHMFTRDSIQLFSEQICNRIAACCYHIGKNEIYISVTAGIALVEELTSPKELFSHAANAMRIARERLVGQLLYDKTMEETQAFEHNMTWASKVKQAIDENRIVPYFQPIVDNQSRTIKKYECLVRLVEKDNSVISPYMFLSIAKQARLYPFITQIMVAKSFAQFAESNYEFSINLSIEDILDQQTHHAIFRTIAQYPAAAQRAIFEITETAEIKNYDMLRLFINEIKIFGCRIAIDDFGSGYSNFAHVMGMNIDFLKIDGSIIKRLDEDKNAQIISLTIAAFARKLGIKTIAEFVHSQAVYEKAVEYGIDFSQGYYFGKPELYVAVETEDKMIMKK